MPSVPTTSLDLTSAEVVADPYPFFAAERAAHPVAWHEASGVWLAFDHASVSAVQRDRRLGRLWHDKEPAAYLEPFNLLHRNQMMENEPPEHTRLRRPVAQVFGRGHVERLLTGMGYAVTAVGDEAEALAALSAIAPAPALLLTDIVLPGPAGPEIARRVRERVPGIAVLYISGYTERGALATTSLDAPLLPKPFTPEQLATAVRSALDGRGEPAA